jgi:5'-deoxynucleotidase YfbR-like HD superfamily hydrolase
MKVSMLSGKVLDIDNPSIDVITPKYIATRLANTIRFGGGDDAPLYSVARHCVILSSLFKDKDMRYQALMHELNEVLVPDIIKPVKEKFPILQVIIDTVAAPLKKQYQVETVEEIELLDHRLGNTEFEYFRSKDVYKLADFTRERLNKYPPLPLINDIESYFREVKYYDTLWAWDVESFIQVFNETNPLCMSINLYEEI